MATRTRWVALVVLTIALLIAPGLPGGMFTATPDAASAARQTSPGEGKTSLDLIEEDAAAGLLDRNNTNRYRQYALSAPEKLPKKYQSSVIGKDATAAALQIALEWEQLSSATKTEILDLQASGFGGLKETVETEHFALHYATQGVSAVPAQDADNNGRPDYIDIAADSLETVWSHEVDELGYPAPKGTPEQRFHVYFKNLKFYGYAQPTNVELLATSPVNLGTASGFIVLENDYAGFPRNDEDRTGQEVIRSGALKVTAAHEFMHAIQFNINVYQSGWLFEAHATWAEDAVYDHINDWHWYINRFLATPDFPIFNRFVYGSAFFFHYLSETHGIDVPRQIWLAGRTNTTPDAVRLAAFGGSWEGMKDFAPAEYLLAISDFTRDPVSVIPRPSNLIRATHDVYPVAVEVPSNTKREANRAPWGLGANFVEFVDDGGSGTLTLTFDGADGFAWRAFAVATPAQGGGGASIVPFTLDNGSVGSVTINGFGTRWATVTLVPTIADRAGVAVPYAYGASLD